MALLAAPPIAAFEGMMYDRVNEFGFFILPVFLFELCFVKRCASSSQAMPSADEKKLFTDYIFSVCK